MKNRRTLFLCFAIFLITGLVVFVIYNVIDLVNLVDSINKAQIALDELKKSTGISVSLPSEVTDSFRVSIVRIVVELLFGGFLQFVLIYICFYLANKEK